MKGVGIMRKLTVICLVLCILIISLCGCDNEKSNDISMSNSSLTNVVDNITQAKNNNPVALTITTNCDYNKLAMSLKQLYEDSDIVCEITIKNVIPYINENGTIVSKITPEIVAIYKGEYNYESFYSYGGRMNYSEYINNEIIQKKLEGKMESSISDEYLNQDVMQVFDDGYVYSVGEQFIFFGITNKEEGGYRQIYGYQGSFKIEGEQISNKALKSDELIYKDINKQLKKNTDNSNMLKFDKNEFVNIIKSYKK